MENILLNEQSDLLLNDKSVDQMLNKYQNCFQSKNESICDICMQDFNNEKNIPRKMASCDHYFC